jgi:hypothetical protein
MRGKVKMASIDSYQTKGVQRRPSSEPSPAELSPFTVFAFGVFGAAIMLALVCTVYLH